MRTNVKRALLYAGLSYLGIGAFLATIFPPGLPYAIGSMAVVDLIISFTKFRHLKYGIFKLMRIVNIAIVLCAVYFAYRYMTTGSFF